MPVDRWKERGRALSKLRERYIWRPAEHLIHTSLFLAAVVAVAVTLGIVLTLLADTIRFFGAVGPVEFYGGTVWSPDIRGLYGALPLIASTLLIAGGAAAIGIPLGLGAALYLREYAPTLVRETVKPVLEVLAGVPTIVYGFFALIVISPALQRWFGADFFNGLNAVIVIGIMVIPMVSSLSEDALTAVPRDLRDGALALGATRLEANARVVLPAAFSGVVASFLLAFSRAVGETMVVLIAAGQQTDLSFDLTRQMTTMAGFVAKRATGDLPAGSTLFESLFAVGFTLFVMTLILNLASDHLRRRFREAYD